MKARHAPAAPLSAAWCWTLMTGEWPTVRLRGWVAMMMIPPGEASDEMAKALWAAHGGTLTQEARAHGFEPAYLTHRPPTGDTFERWARAFKIAHTY
jgi:hypothetical protein